MNLRSLHRICFATAIGLLAAQVCRAQPTAATPSLQERIDQLLKHRLRPEPLPADLPNPFQLGLGATRDALAHDVANAPARPAPDPTPPKEIVGTTHAEVLIGCATRLRLGGVIVLRDQIQIVINGVPRKEGDLVAADWNNSVVHLRVARVLPSHMLLRYGDAEVTVKF